MYLVCVVQKTFFCKKFQVSCDKIVFVYFMNEDTMQNLKLIIIMIIIIVK